MAAVTLNVSLSEEQAALIKREVDAGNYVSASEVIGEAVRLWLERRIAADTTEFERLSAGLWERDTNAEEEAAILRAQKAVRAEMSAERLRKGRRR